MSIPTLAGGKTYSEQTLRGQTLSIADSVIVSLETAQGPAPAGDTGDLGVDAWTFRVGENLEASFGSQVADVRLTVFDLMGKQLISVVEGATSIHLETGTYRLEVRNLGAAPKTVMVGWQNPRVRSIRFKNPGVYVTEVDVSPPPIAGIQTSVAAFIGTAAYIGAGPAPDHMEINRYADLTANFATPLDGYLDDAVRLFFMNGGQTAYIVPIEDETLGSHREALAVVAELVGTVVQSVSAPDSVRLRVSDWTAFVLEANQVTWNRAMFVADPPREARSYANALDLQDALAALELPSGVAMYFPWLIDGAGDPVPPSGALLGVWAANDAQQGVWTSPAGVALPIQGVTAPEVLLTDEQIGRLDVPFNGRSICALRTDPANGDTIAWGARTMDGNADEYRYISFRRTLTYIEQSVNATVFAFVFAPNVARTWSAVISALTDFLNGFWSEGGLAGTLAGDAYGVECGLGSTMTPQDILDGVMRVNVRVAITRPDEFVDLVYEQEQAASSNALRRLLVAGSPGEEPRAPASSAGRNPNRRSDGKAAFPQRSRFTPGRSHDLGK